MAIGWEYSLVDNSDLVKNATQEKILQALEALGIQAEGDVKLSMNEVWSETGTDIVDTGRLRNSISHQVDEGEKAVYVGTNSEYAAYVELGTGEYSEVGGTPEKRWVYKDEATGEWRIGVPQRPRHFIKPAVADHGDTYKEILKEELSK